MDFLKHMDSYTIFCNTWTLTRTLFLATYGLSHCFCNIWTLTLTLATHELCTISLNTWAHTISCSAWTLTSSLAIRNPWTLHFFLPHMDSHTFSCNKLTLTPSRATQGLSKKTTLSRVDVLVNIWTPYSITCYTEEPASSCTCWTTLQIHVLCLKLDFHTS
jgi:hypothetical protein